MPSTEARTGGRKLLEGDPVVGDRQIIGERRGGQVKLRRRDEVGSGGRRDGTRRTSNVATRGSQTTRGNEEVEERQPGRVAELVRIRGSVPAAVVHGAVQWVRTSQERPAVTGGRRDRRRDGLRSRRGGPCSAEETERNSGGADSRGWDQCSEQRPGMMKSLLP